MPDNTRAAARSRPATSKERTAFATGLIIGKDHSHCMMPSDAYWLMGFFFLTSNPFPASTLVRLWLCVIMQAQQRSRQPLRWRRNSIDRSSWHKLLNSRETRSSEYLFNKSSFFFFLELFQVAHPCQVNNTQRMGCLFFREKKLELSVAATGVTDPEKEVKACLDSYDLIIAHHMCQSWIFCCILHRDWMKIL